MSSVTRLHLLSQSMLNVTCQKRSSCSSLPADSLTMEFVGQRAPGACNLLGVPGLGTLDLDDDDGEVVVGIRPKSSPLPRRKSSVSDEDPGPEPPLCGSRRVSFADAKGLSLVQVKEFDTWNIPDLPGFECLEGEGKDAEEYSLSPFTFSLPLSKEELSARVQEQKVELETIELLPGTTTVKGVVRVLNVSFTKAVYVRTTLDTWSSHFDLLAEYIPGSSDGQMDCFSFKLTLVPPFGEQGARVDFCLRYETPVGTFWANNSNSNYVLFCRRRQATGQRRSRQKETVQKRSCLKTVSPSVSMESVGTPSRESSPTDVSKPGEGAIQVPDGQPGNSAEDEEKLQAENRQNCSRRSRRRAARRARVRDYFAQRDGAASVEGRDVSLPDAEQAAKGGEISAADQSESSPEVGGKPEGPGFVYGPQATRNATSWAKEEPESVDTAQAGSLTGSTVAVEIPASRRSDSAGNSAAGTEERGQNQEAARERSAGGATADGVIPPGGSGKSAGDAGSFTFRTVVAPLYRQTLGRVGSDRGNPWDNAADSTQSHPPADAASTADTRNLQRMLETPAEESNKERLSAAVSRRVPGREEAVASDDSRNGVDTPQDPPPPSEGPIRQDQSVNISDVDSLDGETPVEGKAREGARSRDLRDQSGGETRRVQLPGETRQPMKKQSGGTLADVAACERTSSPSPPASVSGHAGGDVEQLADASSAEDAVSQPTAGTSPGEHELSGVLGDLDPGRLDHAAAEEDEDSRVVSCFVEETDARAAETFLETRSEANEADRSLRGDETSRSAGIEFNGEAAEGLHGEADVTAREAERIHARASKREMAEAKNWERMVEEEEDNILADEEESREEAGEGVEKEQGEQTGSDVEEEDDSIGKEMEETEGGTAETTAAGGKDEKGVEDVEATAVGEEWKGADVRAPKTEAGEREAGEVSEAPWSCEPEAELEKHSAVGIEGPDAEGEGDTLGEDEIEIDLGDETDMQMADQAKPEGEDPGVEATETADAGSKGAAIPGEGSEEGSDVTRYKVEGGSPTPVSDAQEGANEREEHAPERQPARNPADAPPGKEEDAQERRAPADDAEIERAGADSASGESDSDDEVELYMHCLRAVHAGTRAGKDPGREAAFSGGGGSKRPPACRSSKLLSTPMPSISESLDEEQHLSCHDNREETVAAASEMRPTAEALEAGGREGVGAGASRWKETFSCGNIAKTLLCATLMMVFLVVAYHYDFLACFGLYLISVAWLFRHGDRQPAKNEG